MHRVEREEESRPAPRRSRTRPAPAAWRATSASAVAAALRDDIVGLVLPPGTPLQDRVLCERFGVSRTPVREALIRLGEEGLVDIFPQSGTFVSRIPVAAVREAVLVRQALEGLTVEGATVAGADVAPLDDALARQRLLAARGDTRGFHEADEAFHEALAAMAGHPGIWRLLRHAKTQIDRARRLTLPVPGRMEKVIGEHREIRDAVARGDAAAARAAMTAHLDVMIPDVERLRSRHPDHFV